MLAAHAADLTEVILPPRNAPDLGDVPAEVRDHMHFHAVGTIDEVLDRRSRPSRSRRPPRAGPDRLRAAWRRRLALPASRPHYADGRTGVSLPD